MAGNTTVLEQRQIDNPMDASREIAKVRFVSARNERHTPIVFKPQPKTCGMFVVIPHGFNAVITRHGQVIGIWKPGFHWAPFWYRIEYLVPWQHIIFESPVKQCPTQDNVMVEIDVTLVFRIEKDDDSTINFVYHLGADRLNNMLYAFQEESIRDMARHKKYNEIFDLMDTSVDAQLANTKRSMNLRLEKFGVVVEHVTITNVHLPLDIQKTMEQETTYESLNRFENTKQQFGILKLDNKEKRAKRAQSVEEDKLAERTEGESNAQTALQKLRETEALAKRSVAEIKESESADIRAIKANSDLTVAELQAQKQIEIARIMSDGQAGARTITSEANASVRLQFAEARKQVALNEAKALESRAKAEQFAATKLAEKRKYEQQMRNLQTLKALAENDQIAISGNNGDNMVAQILSSGNSARALGLNVGNQDKN